MIIGLLFLMQRRLCRSCSNNSGLYRSKNILTPLRPKKPKANNKNKPKIFLDTKAVRVLGGKGGDGCISFLQLWCNERAGPDGGDGGNGGHVIFKASREVRSLNHLLPIVRGQDGQCGSNKECHGKNARHTILKVPVGTLIKKDGVVVGDLDREHLMFVAARGGAGGKGNRFFTTDKQCSIKVCEYGPEGEDVSYVLELQSMANIGLIGFPNAGKTTLLNAITRARLRVAPYAFTTLHPQIGIVQYSDYFQLTVADLPGIIPGSHCNKGLGLQFLNHVERCSVLVYVLDASCDYPWLHYEKINFEMSKFNQKLLAYPKIVVANKIDIPKAVSNLPELMKRTKDPIVNISAKNGTNLEQLLFLIRQNYENNLKVFPTPVM